MYLALLAVEYLYIYITIPITPISVITREIIDVMLAKLEECLRMLISRITHEIIKFCQSLLLNEILTK